MDTLSKNFGKLTMPLLVLLVICLFAVQAQGQYGGGSGTAEEPYLIYTPAQMNTIGAMLLDWDKHFKLMANINLSGYTGTSFFIIGSSSFPFTGVFDGNGHTISNFTYTSTGTDYIGVFGYVDSPGAEIKDLGLIDPNVDAGTADYVGSLVGWLQNGTITGCYVEGGSVSGDSKVGGLVGRNENGAITDCYSTASVSGDWGFGGLVGSSSGIITKCSAEGVSVSGRGFAGGLAGSSYGVILDCHASGSVSAAGYDIRVVGGLVGDNGGTIANCYSQVSVSASDSTVFGTGGLVGTNNGHICNSYATGSVSGVDRVGGLVGYNRYAAVVNCYSTGSVTGVTEVGGLVGLNDGAILASFWDTQTSGRINMCGSVGGSGSGCNNANGKTTAEMQDINTFLAASWDFLGPGDGPSDDWGEPNGGGYMILWWQLPENQLPALPTFSGGTGEPNDPYLIATVSDLNHIGHNPRLMEAHFKLINDIDLAGIDFFFIGTRGYGYSGVFNGNGHTISNFTYSSTGRNNVGLFGGIAGEDAEVKDLGLIDPNINAGTGSSIGSLVGWLADGTVSGCYVDGGSVAGTEPVGGLVGKNSGTITDCHSSGIVSGDFRVGGLVGGNGFPGEVGGTITNCHSSGIVLGDGGVGGLVGSGGVITDCYSTASVSGVFSGVGGLVGGGGTITNCYATGDISGGWGIGGLVGEGGTITNCYATGNVSATVSFAGGLTGGTKIQGTVTNCYATGSVSAPWIVGGLVGRNTGTITNCYAAGSVTGTTEVGGLVGYGSGTVSDCFWDIQTSGQPTSNGGTGKTTAQMQTMSTFTDAGWDFVSVWTIREGVDYPKLAWLQFVTGDFDGDGVVDFTDFAILGAQWQQPPGEPSADIAPDGGDGIVDWFDLAALVDNWPTGPPPGPASNPEPANDATDVDPNAELSWTAASDAISHDVYFGTSSPGTFQGNQTATTFDPGTMVYSSTYYWRIDAVNGWGKTTGKVWSFTTIDSNLQASNPNPLDGETTVNTTADLSWTAGVGATSHDVYFGTSNPPTFQLNQTTTTFNPGTMAYSTTYYWRIDEVNGLGKTEGQVWNFATIMPPPF